MSLEVIKKEFRRRRMAAKKGRVSLVRLRVGALCPPAAEPRTLPSPRGAIGASLPPSPPEPGSPGALSEASEDVMELAAEIEAMLCSEAPAPDGRDPLDRMRSLWRAMRRLLPQLPLLKGSDMRKTELSLHFAGAVGFGWAPLPEWGCPEGADAYMARLSAYVDAAAARRGCGPSQLVLPLSSHGPPA